MLLIAVTGGIASGKSVVSRRLAQLGAVVVDADALAREVVEPGEPALARIAEEFGSPVVGADGRLDRARLARIVFPDAAKRQKLNAIMHPAITARSRERLARAAEADPHAIVVYDVPLLVEGGAGRSGEFDLVVVVHADADTRLERMVALRGMTREEAQQRILSQASDAERLAVADVVVDANGSLEHTIEQTDRLWEQLVRREAAAVGS